MSESGSDDNDSDRHSNEEKQHKFQKLKSSNTKANLDHHSTDSETEQKRFISKDLSSSHKTAYSTVMNNNKKAIPKSKDDSKRSFKTVTDAHLDESSSLSLVIKPKGRVSKSSLYSQSGQSLLAPLSEPTKPISPLLHKNKLGQSTDKIIAKNNHNKNSSLKRTTGYTGLSDSDSDSMDEDKKSLRRLVEDYGDNKSKLSKGKRQRDQTKKAKEHSQLSSSSSSESDDQFEIESESSSSDESEDEVEHERVLTKDDSLKQLAPNNNSQQQSSCGGGLLMSPQTTPNSRLLPTSNIYSKTNHHPPAHISSPFERLYKNIGYHSSNSNSPSGFSYVELREMQCKIDQLTDSELLQQVVDLIEQRNTNCFNIVNNCLQFDLLKLEHSTLVEIKQIIFS